MQVDLTKPVQTKSGRKARVICTDAANSSYPVLALITDDFGHEDVVLYDPLGFHAGGSRAWDLMNIQPEIVGFFNIDRRGNTDGIRFNSSKAAREFSVNEIAGCVKVTVRDGKLIWAEVV